MSVSGFRAAVQKLSILYREFYYRMPISGASTASPAFSRGKEATVDTELMTEDNARWQV